MCIYIMKENHDNFLLSLLDSDLGDSESDLDIEAMLMTKISDLDDECSFMCKVIDIFNALITAPDSVLREAF